MQLVQWEFVAAVGLVALWVDQDMAQGGLAADMAVGSVDPAVGSDSCDAHRHYVYSSVLIYSRQCQQRL